MSSKAYGVRCNQKIVPHCKPNQFELSDHNLHYVLGIGRVPGLQNIKALFFNTYQNKGMGRSPMRIVAGQVFRLPLS